MSAKVRVFVIADSAIQLFYRWINARSNWGVQKIITLKKICRKNIKHGIQLVGMLSFFTKYEAKLINFSPRGTNLPLYNLTNCNYFTLKIRALRFLWVGSLPGNTHFVHDLHGQIKTSSAFSTREAGEHARFLRRLCRLTSGFASSGSHLSLLSLALSAMVLPKSETGDDTPIKVGYAYLAHTWNEY